MPAYKPSSPISSNGVDYDVDNLIDGSVYQITAWFPSGVSGTIGIKERGPDGSFQSVEENGTVLSLTDSGKKSVLISLASTVLRFSVSDLSGGSCFISVKPSKLY